MVQLHGLVDVYASWNPNRPADRDNFEPGTGTTAQRANQFGLNLAAVDVSLDANPVGFHVVAVAGTGTDVVHAAEVHPDSWRYVYQASVSYKLDTGRGVLFELGIQPSHVGYEGFFSKDNWNYTRGWMGEFSPYYQTGLKVATSFDDHWSGQIWLLNGWQNIEDNNGGKAIGTQVAYAKDALGFTVNTFFGPELPDDDVALAVVRRSCRDVEDLFECAAGRSLDLGRQTRPQAGAASWQGASVWLRYLLSNPPSSPLSLFSSLRHRVARRVLPRPGRRRLAPFSESLLVDPHVRIAPPPAADPQARGPVRPLDRRRPSAGRTGRLTKRDEFLLVLGAVATF